MKNKALTFLFNLHKEIKVPLYISISLHIFTIILICIATGKSFFDLNLPYTLYFINILRYPYYIWLSYIVTVIQVILSIYIFIYLCIYIFYYKRFSGMERFKIIFQEVKKERHWGQS